MVPVHARRKRTADVSLGGSDIHGSLSWKQSIALRARNVVSIQDAEGDGARSLTSALYRSVGFRTDRAVYPKTCAQGSRRTIAWVQQGQQELTRLQPGHPTYHEEQEYHVFIETTSRLRRLGSLAF